MLQLNNQYPAVHSIWITKSRVIPSFPLFSKEFTDPLIGDFRPIQVVNNEESTDDDLDIGDDNDLESDDPLADEDSNFDDFDDEFDDDFQEEESDPDWEHQMTFARAPPPSKSSGGKSNKAAVSLGVSHEQGKCLSARSLLSESRPVVWCLVTT